MNTTLVIDCCFLALAAHFKARGVEPDHWFFNTDGAPSHFKNRFTMESLFTFKTTSGASTILWETCAPGHGKGPWDGIGAVVKRLLRELERLERLYATGARDVFCALVLHAKNKQNVHSGVAISTFVYHYILTGNEPAPDGMDNVWSAIRRPSARPTVTAIPGIRSSHVFRVGSNANVLCVRELSCRCRHCMARDWTACKSNTAGPWKRVTMQKTAAAAGTRTRNQRSVISSNRLKVAMAVRAGEIIALESANDAEGFLFWLARAEGPAQKWTGEKKTENGVKFVKQGYYITIRYYERFPPSCPSTFKLSSQSWTVDAEGVLSASIRHTTGRSSRSGSNTNITLPASEIRRLNDFPRLT